MQNRPGSGALTRLAADVEHAISRRLTYDEPGRARAHHLAKAAGWAVHDVICSYGPADRPFEEQHSWVSIGIVVAGTFQYRTSRRRELLIPGSLLLGNAGQCFECSHDHAAGDRCLAISFLPEYFESIAADAGARTRSFQVSRLPPLRALARVCAQATTGMLNASTVSWGELALQLAGEAIRAAHGLAEQPLPLNRGAERRVTESVRSIVHEPAARLSLPELAAQARLSAFHYLRTFERLTGVTPHQFIMRTRLREAAARLVADSDRVIEVAYDTGFGDVSNFNRAFRAEFGLSPRRFRAAHRTEGN
ncbi:MAG TPA: AraC family transcriptional regulator [Longimicrobiales bacterium]|nr:AraC family transcriptional regulator [Longimicrobiales bacterium]